MKLSNKSALYHWKDKAISSPSFVSIIYGSGKRRNVEIDGKMTDIGLISGVINAASALVIEELTSGGGVSFTNEVYDHIAAGTSTVSGGAEAIFTEYTAHGSDILQAVCYNPLTGDVSACVREEGRTNTTAMRFREGYQEAFWLALLLHARSTDLHIMKALDVVKEALKSEALGRTPGDPDYVSLEDGADKGLAAICFHLYMALTKDGTININLADDAEKFRKINNTDLEGGEMSPSKGKRIFSNSFDLFYEGKKTTASYDPSTIDFTKYEAIPWERSFDDLTELEKGHIPEKDAFEAPSPILIDILDEMLRTFSKRPALRCNRILLEGGSGSGKSYLARSIARHLKRPYYTHVCGTTDGPEDFQGVIVPYVEHAGKKILTPTAECPREKLEAYLANPELIWPKDIEMDLEFDPEEGVKTLKEKFNTVLSVAKAALSGGDVKASENKGIQYEYIPSAIATAIEHGGILEVQEPTCLIQQGALSCLYDVLDKGSTGYFKTPVGEIKRHTDFVCIFTQNRKYKGTKPLNEAARNRFTYVVKMDDPAKPVLMNRLKVSTEIKDDDLISNIVDMYQALKDAAEELNCDGVASFRNLQDFADALNDGVDTQKAFETHLLNAITTDDEDQADLIESVEDFAILDGVYH